MIIHAPQKIHEEVMEATRRYYMGEITADKLNQIIKELQDQLHWMTAERQKEVENEVAH